MRHVCGCGDHSGVLCEGGRGGHPARPGSNSCGEIYILKKTPQKNGANKLTMIAEPLDRVIFLRDLGKKGNMKKKGKRGKLAEIHAAECEWG